jgi:glycerol-3-phosphate cytidylyltransferase-like family protein
VSSRNYKYIANRHKKGLDIILNMLCAAYNTWDEMFNQLLEFKQKHGHLKVSTRCNENGKLGRWVLTNRSKYREYKQTNGQKGDLEQMKCLESIGLVDDISAEDHAKGYNSSRWEDMFNQLLEFKLKHGHVKIPQKYDENPKLGIWVMRWRSKYREYKRTNEQKGDPKQMKRLESIGLVDDISTGYEKARVTNSTWDYMFNQLLEFKKKHGHVKIPQKYNENRKLGIWVTNWRNKYREYKRTNGQKGDPERMKCLESIGLVNDISTGDENARVPYSAWDVMFNQLLEFKQKHGHVTKVSQQYDENKKLGRWVNYWRSAYKEYKRTNGQKGDLEQMKCLESIGLVDDISAEDHTKSYSSSRWEEMFNQLLKFKQKHGHVKVPQRYDENKKLGIWVKKQRRAYREYKRTDKEKGDLERMKCLESIGLVDDIIKEHEDKVKDCADNKVFAPIIVSSMSPMLSSDTQNITEEMPLSTVVKGGKNGESGDDNTQVDLDFLGSDLRGGFWA